MMKNRYCTAVKECKVQQNRAQQEVPPTYVNESKATYRHFRDPSQLPSLPPLPGPRFLLGRFSSLKLAHDGLAGSFTHLS
jgi:hypothetical protein